MGDLSGMKYQLLMNDSKSFKHPISKRTVKLFRIYCLSDFETFDGKKVLSSQLGGYIESESNLNQDDKSWLFNNAEIFDDALLIDSTLYDTVKVFGSGILQNSIIKSRVRIWTSGLVKNSQVFDNVDIFDSTNVNNCIIKNSCKVHGYSSVEGSILLDGSRVSGNAKVFDSTLKDVSEVSGVSEIRNCHFSGRTYVNNAVLINETREDNIELKIVTNNE